MRSSAENIRINSCFVEKYAFQRVYHYQSQQTAICALYIMLAYIYKKKLWWMSVFQFDNCFLLDVEGDIDWSMSVKAREMPTWVKRGKCRPPYLQLLETRMLRYCLQQTIGHCHHLQKGPTHNTSASIGRSVSNVRIMYIGKILYQEI